MEGKNAPHLKIECKLILPLRVNMIIQGAELACQQQRLTEIPSGGKSLYHT